MARFTREQQIRGLEKALANPRTPAHLKPSMRLRLEKLQTGRPLDTGEGIIASDIRQPSGQESSMETFLAFKTLPNWIQRLFGGE